MKKHTFTAAIQNAGGGGAYVEVPFDAEKAFGSKRPKVKTTIDKIPYRGRLVRTPALPGTCARGKCAPGASVGTECHLLLILKSIRVQTGKTFGDEVHLTVEADTSPRIVELPEGLKRVFQSEKEAKAFFEKLSYNHQKEYVTWINDARKEETRQARVIKTIEMLKRAKRNFKCSHPNCRSNSTPKPLKTSCWRTPCRENILERLI